MAPFILSQVPETTLLLRNPGRENISLLSLENSTNRSQNCPSRDGWFIRSCSRKVGSLLWEHKYSVQIDKLSFQIAFLPWKNEVIFWSFIIFSLNICNNSMWPHVTSWKTENNFSSVDGAQCKVILMSLIILVYAWRKSVNGRGRAGTKCVSTTLASLSNMKRVWVYLLKKTGPYFNLHGSV